MTLTELKRTLPNGFHDAELYNVSVDYLRCRVEMRFGVFVDLMPNNNIIFRHGKVMLSGVEYFVVQPPQYGYDTDDAAWITSDDEGLLPDQPPLPDLEQEGAFRHWFFISNWNACIYLAASDAQMEWETE